MGENSEKLGKNGRRPKDMEEIIVEARTGKGKIHDILEKERDNMMDELETTKIQRILEEEKQKIDALRRTNQPVPQAQAQNFVQMMLAGRSATEIKEILEALGPEHMEKLSMMASAMNPGGFQGLQAFLRQPSTSGKDIVEAVRTGAELSKERPQTSNTGSISDITKSMAEMFKTGVELGKGQVAPPQQNTLEMFKTFHEMYLKPVLDQLASKDRENLELRMSHMESQRIDPLEYLKSIKQASSDLGLSQNTRSEIDLKLEEMREMHDIEMAKYGLETRKWEHQKDSEGKTIEQVKDLVKTVTEGPIGSMIENIGSGAADRIRRGKGNNTPLVHVRCPNCQGEFNVNPALHTVTCIHCGATLQSAQPPQNTQSTPAPQPEPSQEAPNEQVNSQENKPSDQSPNEPATQ